MLSDYRHSGRAALTRHPKLARIATLPLLRILTFALLCPPAAIAQSQNWTLTSAPTNNWSAICGSSDLSVLAATVDGGGIYYSTNSGENWYPSDAPSNSWSSIACATNGKGMVAAASGGGIWIASGYGDGWSLTEAPTNDAWASVASSANGQRLAAVVAGGGIWTSADSGQSWAQTSAPTNVSPYDEWQSIASSSDGSQLTAVQYGAYSAIYVSTNFGLEWSENGGPLDGLQYRFAACSGDGRLVGVGSCCEGWIYISTNSGLSWIWAVYGSWAGMACSVNGSKLVAAGMTQGLFASANFGQRWSWSAVDAPTEDWQSVILSADGNKLAGVVSGGGIYTWRPTAPFVASEPQSQAALGGLGSSLEVGVFSTAPLFYQWQLDGTNIAGAINSSFSLASADASNSGTYSVIVSNSYGTTVSSNAVMTVIPAFISTLSADYGISDALLGGSVTTGSNDTVVWFNWGADTNYGNVTQAYSVPDGAASLNFSNRITGLSPYTSYHYQAVASNVIGVVYGADATFTTAPRFVPTEGPNGAWGGLVWSASGSIMYSSASNVLYLSTNSGVAWTAISSAGLQTYATSADGTKLVGFNGTELFLTTNSGVTWSSNSTPVAFYDLATSADLTKLAAIGGNNIYVSTNTGATWGLTSAPGEGWFSIASSGDGSELFALYSVREGGVLYASFDSGGGWEYFAGASSQLYVSSVCCSADGNAVMFIAEGSYITTNAGVSWAGIEGIPFNGYNAGCSADGRTMALFCALGPPIYNQVFISPDYGVNWYLANAPGASPILVSADGSKLAALYGGTIYLSDPNPSPVLNLALSGNNALLTWMQPTTNFLLQQSSDLVNWSTVTNTPTLNITNLQNQLTLPLTQAQSFYRLKTP